jgi:hypothetical protein
LNYPAEVERVLNAARRAGITVSRAELLAALGRAGCQITRPRDRWVALPSSTA